MKPARWLAWPASRANRILLQCFLGLVLGFGLTLLIAVGLLSQIRGATSPSSAAVSGGAAQDPVSGEDPNAGLSNLPVQSNPGAALGSLPVATTARSPTPTETPGTAPTTARPTATATHTSAPHPSVTVAPTTVPTIVPPTRTRTPTPTPTRPTTTTRPSPTPTRSHRPPPTPTAQP